MPKRLFLDANVLFTAAISPQGVSAVLFEFARVGVCVALSSSFALDEALRNVRVNYPASIGALKALADELEVVSEADAALVAWAADLLPLKDAPILAAAVVAKAHVLVTGDRRHLGTFYGKILNKVTILPPRDALERLLSS